MPSRLQQFEDRSALALAEALIPGSNRFAAADEGTVKAVRELIAHVDKRLVKAWEVAQATLAAAAIMRTGRPFHLLSADAQDALLRRWEADPVLRMPLYLVSLVYKFVHFDRKLVYEKAGGHFNVVQSLEMPRWLEQIVPGDTLSDGETVECEVVVVGTGAGGAVVGRELADMGFAVLFVEEGEHYRRDSFDGSSVRAHERFYRMAFSVGNTVMPIGVGRLVGGSTAINTGTCFRTPPWILDRWCEDFGTDEFSTSSMERYFNRVEEVLEVAPCPRKIAGPIADVISRGCDKFGWSHGPLLRNAPGCDGGGFCDFGCRTDARRSTNLSYLPPALERGSMVYTGLRADRVIIEQGRATGLEVVSKSGRKAKVRAQAVILAGGAIPTPLLLLNQGIANHSGQVGRNLTLHPSAGLMAFHEDEIRPFAHVPQGYHVSEFLKDGILIIGSGPDFNLAPMMLPFSGRRLMAELDNLDHMAAYGLLLRDAGTGRVWRDVGGVPAISYNITEKDGQQGHKAMIKAAEMSFAAGATKVYPVVNGLAPLENERDLDRFRKMKVSGTDMPWLSYHPLGTCRMGRDPKTSVVGLDHQVHEVPGLYIVDGSTIPGPLGVNPQITIMSVATRAAEKIAEHLQVKSFSSFQATG